MAQGLTLSACIFIVTLGSFAAGWTVAEGYFQGATLAVCQAAGIFLKPSTVIADSDIDLLSKIPLTHQGRIIPNGR